jgi:hypothetical protein
MECTSKRGKLSLSEICYIVMIGFLHFVVTGPGECSVVLECEKTFMPEETAGRSAIGNHICKRGQSCNFP